MARAALGWNMQETRFESGACQPRGVTLEALRGALEAAGVEFIAENDGGGREVEEATCGGELREVAGDVSGIASKKFTSRRFP
jgi:hypothetical protein